MSSTSLPIRHSGWLWKFSVGHTSFGIRNWRKRYFECDEQCARYYTDETRKCMKGAIYHANIVRVFPNATGAGVPPELQGKDVFVFAIQFTTKATDSEIQLLMLATEAEDVRTAWIQLLQTLVAPSCMESGKTAVENLDTIRVDGVDNDDDEEAPSSSRPTKFNVGVSQSPFTNFLNTIRVAVSGNKRRFKAEEFDLDLTYVTPRIIAMGYPSEGSESLYRNPMSQVVTFLEQQHSSNYKVYNLCSERAYAPTTFNGRFERFPFDDHSPPPLEMMELFVKSAMEWLNEHPDRIVAIHCKAGKGRTGLMVSCLLAAIENISTAEAMKFYNNARTVDGKGVTIPSQIRYVRYFDDIWNKPKLTPRRVIVNKIVLQTTPHFDLDGGCDPYLLIKHRGPTHRHRPLGQDRSNVHNPLVTLYDSRDEIPTRHEVQQDLIDIEPVSTVVLEGDVNFLLMDADVTADELMCNFWVNTSLLPSTGSYILEKTELDRAIKDKKHMKFDASFRIILYYRNESACENEGKLHRATAFGSTILSPGKMQAIRNQTQQANSPRYNRMDSSDES